MIKTMNYLIVIKMASGSWISFKEGDMQILFGLDVK